MLSLSVSEYGSSLFGVNVVIKGITNGTVSDTDGNYTLSLNVGGPTLVLSFIGLQSQKVVIGGRSVLAA
jgi:hypothetical protein